MTSNREKATEIIEPWIDDRHGRPEDNAESAVDALADAGVLAPDLPAPNRQGRWNVTAASFGSVTTSPAGEVVLEAGNFRDMPLYLSPDKARNLARTLQAAADYAQKEDSHEQDD